MANRFYAHARASVAVILPPMGSARSAVMLLECIEKYLGHPIFHSPRLPRSRCARPVGSTGPMSNTRYHVLSRI